MNQYICLKIINITINIDTLSKAQKIDQKIHFAFYNGRLWENKFGSINKENICLKNNTAQLNFILERASLHLNFSSLLRDASDNNIFLTVHMIPTFYWKIY